MGNTITPEQYQRLWETMVIDPTRQKEIDAAIKIIKDNYHTYTSVQLLTGVPWYVIGAIHYRESSFNFKRHLSNGDPLTARTTHVPAGRPLIGMPPFTWEESAVDALKLRNLQFVKTWEVPMILRQCERYNGGGYMKRNVNSPYVWAATNHYGVAPNIGKYVADGKFDATVKDKQLGCAAILKELLS